MGRRWVCGLTVMVLPLEEACLQATTQTRWALCSCKAEVMVAVVHVVVNATEVNGEQRWHTARWYHSQPDQLQS